MIENTLEIINNVRQVLDLEPLETLRKGKKKATRNCPLINSLSEVVLTTGMTEIVFHENEDALMVSEKLGWELILYDDGASVRIPQTLCTFINMFDDGNFPELEL